MTDGSDHLGLIRPEHAVNGWRLEGDDPGRWMLVKRFGDEVAEIRPTTPWTVAWTIRVDGRTVREASEHQVGDAKSNAAMWIAENRAMSKTGEQQ
jgi:hypothetical protein